MQLLIYTPQITPRVKYIFNFLFREIIKLDFELTSVGAKFLAHIGPRFSYSDKPIADELFFCAEGLLFAHKIEPIKIELGLFGDEKVPFAVRDGAIPFDIFAASFYLISRYEEYTTFNPDTHDRFTANQSLQHKLNALQKPLIDQWALILKNLLASKFPSLVFGSKTYTFIPTIDIDRALYFKRNGLLKNTARFFQAILKQDIEKIRGLIGTGLGKQKDPYDTYAYLHQVHQQYGLKALFFFLLAKNVNNEHDVNLFPEDELLKEIITSSAANAKIGIHPSYASNTDENRILTEKQTLEVIIGKRIVDSRQHFLKLSLPKTYLKLIKAGILHDYTMGYADEVGFRAGTCTPFFWYDLQLEKQSHLMVHPFAVMDVTLRKYLNLSPEKATTQITTLINNVKLVNGTFYSLWHNESISEIGVWKNWRKVYEDMLIQGSNLAI